jgi:hypothetical protein
VGLPGLRGPGVSRPRRRPAVPAPAPPAPVPSRPDPAALLDTLGALRFAPVFGFWAYMLFEDTERQRPFYAGMSGHLCSRLGDHHDSWGGRLADIWVIPCTSEHQARVTQLMLIAHFEDQLTNVLGSKQYERYRAEAEHEAKLIDSPARLTQKMRPSRMPA